MSFDVALGALARAQGEVVETSEEMRGEQMRIDGVVNDLFAHGWSGPAANAFRSAWAQWREGAADVLSGLEHMGQALALAHRDYLARDALEQGRLTASGEGLGAGAPSAAGGPPAPTPAPSPGPGGRPVSGLNMGV